jgi:hypothetical protein
MVPDLFLWQKYIEQHRKFTLNYVPFLLSSKPLASCMMNKDAFVFILTITWVTM